LKCISEFSNSLSAQQHVLQNSGPIQQRLHDAFREDARLLADWHKILETPLAPLLRQLDEDTFETAGTPTPTSRDVATTCNEWLRRVALVDLHDRVLSVAQVGEKIADVDRTVLTGILPPESSGQINEHRKKLHEERVKLRQRLSNLQRAATQAQPAVKSPSADTSAADVTPFLDAIRAGFFSPLLEPNDVGVVEQALAERRIISVHGIDVGESGWVGPLRVHMQQRTDFVQRLRPLTGESPESSGLQAQLLVDLVARSLDVVARDAESGRLLADELVREGLDAPLTSWWRCSRRPAGPIRRSPPNSRRARKATNFSSAPWRRTTPRPFSTPPS
jgi:hypothetical protein